MATPNFMETIRTQASKIGQNLSKGKDELLTGLAKRKQEKLESMTPEDRALWEGREKAIKDAHAKVTEHAANFTNSLKDRISTASERVKEFGKNVTANNVSTAALTTSHDVAQSAIQKIEQICSKYQKSPRPGSVAAELRKTAGRRRNKKRTIRKRR